MNPFRRNLFGVRVALMSFVITFVLGAGGWCIYTCATMLASVPWKVIGIVAAVIVVLALAIMEMVLFTVMSDDSATLAIYTSIANIFDKRNTSKSFPKRWVLEWRKERLSKKICDRLASLGFNEFTMTIGVIKEDMESMYAGYNYHADVKLKEFCLDPVGLRDMLFTDFKEVWFDVNNQ